ncbi:MBG domain-containing protein [Nocardioides sp.]|uniref:MBG domain-containing protein n=1 Tax=Nocardioides sp. TaxID=35761 RepID=UPI00262D24B3|nr:MBG domain-containing protein [Nocardioides sp.]
MPATSRTPRSSLARVALGALASLLATAALVVVPSSPASAIQTIAWTAAPPATAQAGQSVSFAWTGTANTFLGARITGCFATFPDGNNLTNSFGGNFQTGSCQYANRQMPSPGTYAIVVGFTLSTGGTMSMTGNVSVVAPTPTVVTSGNVVTTATSEQGAPVTFSAYGSDNYYGTYGATCTPASGSIFAPGTTTVSCSATNNGGKTGTGTLTVSVDRATPTLAWTPGQVVAGRPLGSVLDATVSPANLTGSLTYTDAANNVLTPSSILTAGDGQVLTATFVPTGPSAPAFTPVSTTRTVDVVRLAQAVTFGTVPATATVDDAPFEVTASGTSGGGDVTVSRVAGSACTVADHSTGTTGAATVTVIRNGACVLEARQAQTASHTASPVVERSVTVARRTPVITWDPDTEITYGTPLADQLDAATDAAGTWTYRLDGVEVDGSTIPGAGDDRVFEVVFSPADPDRYTTAAATRAIDVHRAAQQLSVSPLADRTYGQAPFEVDVTDDGPGAVSVDVTGPCSATGRTVTPSAAGDCEVTVSKAGDADHVPASVVRTLHVAKGEPTLDWQQPEGLSYGDALGAEELDATVSAEVDDSAVAPEGELTYTLADGSPADGAVLEPGDHVIDVRWMPTGASADRWTSETRSVTVTVAPVLPAISWDPPATIVFGTPLGDDQLDATTSPEGATGTIDYYLADGVTPARGEVLGVGTGQLLVAHYEPDAAARSHYLPAWRTVIIDVAKAPQEVSFGDVPTDVTADDAPFEVTADGTQGGGAVTISAATHSSCTVVDHSAGTAGAATVTVTGSGSCVLEAGQAETPSRTASPVVQRSVTAHHRTPVITWGSAASLTYGDTLADLLDASTDARGSWTYRLDGDVVDATTVPGAGQDRQLGVAFTPADPGRHTTATASRTLTVARAPQQLVVAPIADRTSAQGPFDLVVTDQGPGAVTVTASGPCSVDGRTVTPSAAGDCELTVTKAADANHLPATVTRSVHITKASQTIAFDALTDKTYGDPDVLLQGSGGASGRAVTFTATGACTVAGTRLTLLRAGTCTVTAAQAAGGEGLDPAGSVTRTFTIARAALTVMAPSAVRRYGAAEPALVPSYRGFANGDDAQDLTTPATCASSAGVDSPAGTYAVACAGATSPNYSVTTTDGQLRVRYGLRGLTWALAADAGKGVVEKGSRTPVSLHLRDAAQAVVPRNISAEMGRECRVTMSVGDADPTCFRYDRKADRLVAVLDARGLARGSVVRVVLKVRTADGTQVLRREVDVRLR